MTGERLVQVLLLGLLGTFFAVCVLAPMGMLGWRAFSNEAGFTLDHVMQLGHNPRLLNATWNSIWVGALTATITVPLAFFFAYSLTRTALPAKPVFAAIGYLPILVPSLLPALALVYLFGTQGLLRPWMGEAQITGWPGIVLANVIATFPHALILLRTTLQAADGRLYEAGRTLGATGGRMFWRVTLPGARHGIVSAVLVVFMLTIADVGAPKVVGGSFDVLALEIYRQVLGQQNFAMGGVVAMALLVTSLTALLVERWASSRQALMRDGRASAFVPAPDTLRDVCAVVGCSLIALALVGVLAVCQIASLVRFWPYDLTLTLAHYQIDQHFGGGWAALTNSLALAGWTALLGTLVVFTGAYLLEKTPLPRWLSGAFSAIAFMPAAIPGLALGLGFALLVSHPTSPLLALQGSMALLVLANISHFYTVAHLGCVAALKSLDPQFEVAARVMGRSVWSVAGRVSLPMSAPALLDIALYLFVNAMTTVSVVVFVYGAQTPLASIAVLNMDDAGDIAPAAAMGMVILYVNLAVRVAGGAMAAGLQRAMTWKEA